MTDFNLNEHPHRRKNILTGEWILVSPHRAKRPWQGKLESLQTDKRQAYDQSCYLCPGNRRSEGKETNPHYKGTYVFDNDFSALKPDIPEGKVNKDNLLIADSETGICKVVCFSPRHDKTLPELDNQEIKGVIDTWIEQYMELGNLENINYVQIFENKGEMMGCSNPHPHGQIWAESSIPMEIVKEDKHFEDYYNETTRSLLGDYLKTELRERDRIVYQNNSFVILVPFWATWPFETIIISRNHIQNIAMLDEEEKYDFADAIKVLTTKYDNLFNTSFPYSAGIHQAPTDGENHFAWHLHMHFYPPLLRSATIKKYMVGYELLANPQRDITPEVAAQKLRELLDVHYKLAT